MTYPKISNKKCKYCGQNIVMKRKRDEIQEFCNRKCSSQFILETKFEKQCKRCSITFTTIPSHDYDFCSKQCSNQSRSIIHIRNCERCNKEFVLDNVAYEKRGGGRFCSRECATRIYSFNEDYFEKIDTSEKAYWLGILFSDGNIYKNQMTIKLIKSDERHLHKLKVALNSEHPMHYGKDCAIFFIGSKKLCSDLINLRMIPNKSLTVEFPKLPSKYRRDFIRGVFDGDGCIYVNQKKNNHKTWSIYSGSERFILELQKTLETETGAKVKLNKQKKGYRVYGSNKQSVKEIFDYMYKDASVFLERKRDKFLL